MKIISLETENVKRIKVVHITPKGAMVVVGGKNAQGKTSVLDSIMMALAGGKAVSTEPIRRGQEKAEIRLDLGEFVVTRKFDAKTGTSLVVTDGVTGARITSPQGILDKLTAKIAFDPIGFARMVPLAQFEELRKLLGLDFAAMDGERAKIYAERTAKNREVENQKHRILQMPQHPKAPEKAPESAELLKRLEEANKWNDEIETAQRELSDKTRILGQIDEEILANGRKIKELQAHISSSLKEIERIKTATKELEPIAIRKPADVTPIQTEIASAAEIRSQVEANTRRAEEMKTLRTLEKASDQQTKAIESIDSKKADMISKAKFPIEGLGFAEQIVTFNGIAFSEASEAEKLRVSVAMGIAMNPKLKVLLVRDGSLLDEDNLKLIAEMAEAQNSQVWVERVGKGSECSIIIEDGQVLEDRTVETAAK